MPYSWEGSSFIYTSIFSFENFYNTESLYFHIQTSARKHKYPILIVHFLVSADTYSISRYFIFKYFVFTSEMFWGFLWHGTYYVVVKEGSHFCQSPKGGDQDFFFLLKCKEGPTLFGKKYQNSPEKMYFPQLTSVTFT